MLVIEKALGIGLAGALIFAGVQTSKLYASNRHLNDAKEVVEHLSTWRDDVVTAVSLASGTPTTEKTTRAQVQALGATVVTLRTTVTNQNTRIEQLAEARRVAELRAEREAKARAGAIARAEDLASQMRDSSNEAVAPQDTNEEVRRVQDAAYDAGL